MNAAAYLQVSIGTISNYENNVHSPDLATLCRLADYFGVATDYLLGRTACRGTPEVLNQPISDEYTVSDIINTVLTFDSSTVNHLIEYAKFLQAKLSH
ncbi:MAG: helix-turn-helix domain-containing protein [Acetatifactor sp.]|nr:helix-turn-helix domain-containing protein [Acetatifactor sp.]